METELDVQEVPLDPQAQHVVADSVPNVTPVEADYDSAEVDALLKTAPSHIDVLSPTSLFTSSAAEACQNAAPVIASAPESATHPPANSETSAALEQTTQNLDAEATQTSLTARKEVEGKKDVEMGNNSGEVCRAAIGLSLSENALSY